MLFKLSNLNSNLALTLGYLNPALNNSALDFIYWTVLIFILIYFEWRDSENQQLFDSLSCVK